jgi:hypothetical protein
MEDGIGNKGLACIPALSISSAGKNLRKAAAAVIERA